MVQALLAEFGDCVGRGEVARRGGAHATLQHLAAGLDVDAPAELGDVFGDHLGLHELAVGRRMLLICEGELLLHQLELLLLARLHFLLFVSNLLLLGQADRLRLGG